MGGVIVQSSIMMDTVHVNIGKMTAMAATLHVVASKYIVNNLGDPESTLPSDKNGHSCKV